MIAQTGFIVADVNRFVDGNIFFLDRDAAEKHMAAHPEYKYIFEVYLTQADVSLERSKIESMRRIVVGIAEQEDGFRRAFRIDRPGEMFAKDVAFLVVNENTIAAGIMPLRYGKCQIHQIEVSSLVVEITPDEYEKLVCGEMCLPDGWRIGQEIKM